MPLTTVPKKPAHRAPDSPRPSVRQPAAGATATGELADLLYERHRREHVHTPWRNLIAGAGFAPRPGLSAADRTALAYQRLRMVNDALDSPAELARDTHRLVGLHEWTGVVDSGLTTLAAIHYNLFLGSLLEHGGARDTSGFTTLRRTGTFLCTELDHGNDAAALETIAVLDPADGGFVLHTPVPGAQKFMPNTSPVGGPKTALVAARLLAGGEDQGVFLFLTPLSDETGTLPGITVRPLPERLGSPVDHCLTSFDQVRLPRTALLETSHGQLHGDGSVHNTPQNRRKRFLRSIGRVTTGKLCMSGAALAVSRTALAVAVRYAATREISAPQAGRRVPLTAHRSHHGRLLNATATAYAMTFLHRTAVDRWAEHADRTERDDGAEHPDAAEAERLVAIAKGWNTWQARDIVTECRERCGARALFTVNRLAEMAADLEGTITAEGDNLVIWLKAAAEMIFGHRAGPCRTQPPEAGTGKLADAYYLRDLLADVESIWQHRARQALRNGPSGDPVARWNATSTTALEAVSAHARLQATDAFLTAARQAPTPTTRILLERLCRLFLLTELAQHTGDLLAEERITAEQVRALPGAVDTLHDQLADELSTFVDAFDLPPQVLGAIPLTHNPPSLAEGEPPVPTAWSSAPGDRSADAQ